MADTSLHASISAVAMSCARCGARLGRLARDGLGVVRRDRGTCPHHDDVPLDVQQALWRAHEDEDGAEVVRLERDHQISAQPIP